MDLSCVMVQRTVEITFSLENPEYSHISDLIKIICRSSLYNSFTRIDFLDALLYAWISGKQSTSYGMNWQGPLYFELSLMAFTLV